MDKNNNPTNCFEVILDSMLDKEFMEDVDARRVKPLKNERIQEIVDRAGPLKLVEPEPKDEVPATRRDAILLYFQETINKQENTDGAKG